MIRLSQRDPRWLNVKIGKSISTIGNYGCLITARCMIFNKFHPGHWYWPDQAAREGVFIGNNMDWVNTKYPGMKFVKRVVGYDPVTVKEWVKKPDFGVVIQVLTKSGVHWLAVWDWGIFGKPVCFDPWDKTVIYNPYGLLGKYRSAIGYAVLEKTCLV